MQDLIETQSEISISEAVQLGATDFEFFSRFFFDRAFRNPSPQFALDMNEALADPTIRLLEFLVFRGGAKTTRLRSFIGQRISYGISRTVLVIGAAEKDSIRTLNWLRNAVDRNQKWAGTFNLHPGRKWEETQIEIEHRGFGHTINVVGAGINGSLRGINFDDYRPDLIIVDDPQTDEMAASFEQREKVSDLLLGAVENSLAPVIDEPNAKMVMAITPQHKDDVSYKALNSTRWTSIVCPVWTKESMGLRVEEQVSSWPERFPTDDLRVKKFDAAREGKLHIWTREMECRVTSPEAAELRQPWLQTFEIDPEGSFNVLAIDPVPPPSDKALATGKLKSDFECHAVWGRYGGNYYQLHYDTNRGHNPDWSIANIFSLARRYRVSRIVVETVAYQRVLKWMLEKEMQRRGIYYSVVAYNDKRSKYNRIISAYGNLAPHGKIFIKPTQVDFIEQFSNYPNVTNDDILDAGAIALSEMVNPFLEDGTVIDEAEIEDFPLIRACP